MGATSVALLADTVVSRGNDLAPGKREISDPKAASTVVATIGESSLEMEFDGQQDGVAMQFSLSLLVHPCPDRDGRFDITAKLTVRTSKGGLSTDGTIDIKVDGRVDDDARLIGTDLTTNTQWGGVAGGQRASVETTLTRIGGVHDVTNDRSVGPVTSDLRQMASFASSLLAAMVEDSVVKAAEKAWASGRCVALTVTPSEGPLGLAPATVVSVHAQPRSKLDRAPTGGMVTATLTGGGAFVDPNGSPVQADADSSYTAPDEPDKGGTVAYESRSRRGVGKAELTFRTSAPAAFRIVGGLQEWKVNQVVCDIMQPFTLTGAIGSMQLSGGLAGTYVFDGMFASHYEGTYQVTLPDGPSKPGTMVGAGSGTVAGQAGSGSETYALTPVTC